MMSFVYRNWIVKCLKCLQVIYVFSLKKESLTWVAHTEISLLFSVIVLHKLQIYIYNTMWVYNLFNSILWPAITRDYVNLLQVADAFVLLYLVRAPDLWPSNIMLYILQAICTNGCPQSNLPSPCPCLIEGDRHHLVLEHSLDANVVGLFRISWGKRVIGGARQLGGRGKERRTREREET